MSALNDPMLVFDEEFDEEFDLHPPPLCHQRSMECAYDHSDSDELSPVYRSLSVAGPSTAAFGVSEVYVDPEPVRWRSSSYPPDPYAQDPYAQDFPPSCETSPVYRNCRSAFTDGFGAGPGGRTPYHEEVSTEEVCPAEVCTGDASMLVTKPFHKWKELPPEIFDMVLERLDCHPDLFLAKGACQLWRDAARANAARRRIYVPPAPDALLIAVASAGPGDTLILGSGMHTLSKELCLDKPVRLLGPTDPATATAVLCSHCHVVLRTRCVAALADLTLCRLGDEIGYPNAVVFAEAGNLSVESCRITCGGAAATVEEALCAFDGAPRPGQRWTAELPLFSRLEATADEQRLDRPQSGVWVGAAAAVRMSRCTISCTLGPGIKIYRGQVDAEECTVAFSCRGANVVANGGTVRLRRNEIRGAFGDGVSAWNNAHLDVASNHIHLNSGCGVAINSSGGKVQIRDNTLVDNSKAGVCFVTSQAQQAVLHENEFDRNGGGSVQGLQSSRRSRPDWPVPRHSNHSGEIG